MNHTFILSFSLMASSIHFASPILMAILFHFLLDNRICFASNPTRKTPTGLRLALTRVDFDKRLPNNQYALSSSNDAPRSSMKNQAKSLRDEYVMNLAIGTPPVMFSALVDTGSDLIWTKCTSSSSSPRLFDTSKSLSYSKLNESCESYQLSEDCQQNYEDGTSINVSLGRETLTMGGMKFNATFGCGTPSGKDFKYDGIVGMGRGKLSLISQLNEHVFSYCFGSRFLKSERSILQIGTEARESIANNMIQTTPLMNQGSESYYYISLEGISVGETRLPVTKSDFAIENGDGGMIIDSGTPFTYLEKRIVKMIEEEFMNQTKFEKVKGSDTTYNTLASCFSYPYDVKIVPKLVFHFTGANWDMPRENYIYEKNHRACLAFVANEDDKKVSIFGNMQQQNMMVLYDLEKNSLSFAPANCNK